MGCVNIFGRPSYRYLAGLYISNQTCNCVDELQFSVQVLSSHTTTSVAQCVSESLIMLAILFRDRLYALEHLAVPSTLR